MAFRFFRRKTLFPGVTLNMSKSGPSISFGPRGLRHTIGPRGRRSTVGLPGTGLHYSVQHGKRNNRRAGAEQASEAGPPPTPLPDLDTALAQADEDRIFLRSVVAFQNGASATDMGELAELDEGDAWWLRGMAALRDGDWGAAVRALRTASQRRDLGALFERNDVLLQVAFPITPEITAHIEPEPMATRLALVEALQEQGDLREALALLKTMNAEAPEDFVVAMSLAEIAFEVDDGRSVPMKKLAEILSRATPDPDLGWALTFYTARARTRSGAHLDAAALYENTMNHPSVPEDMRMLAWYEMALTHGEAGNRTRCRQELSAIYAVNKTFADVADRIRGLTS